MRINKFVLVFLTLVVGVTTQGVNAFTFQLEELQTTMQNVFGDKPVVLNDYNSHLTEVIVDNSKVYYASRNGQYLFAGPIFDIAKRTNIVSLRENQLRQAFLSTLPKDIFVNYPSVEPAKFTVTVFTDIDCQFCRKLHSHMTKFNQLGVTVNYILLPRAGLGSKSHRNMLAALCSVDPAETITKAMRNEPPAPNDCKTTTMNQHLEIARDLKIDSTPTLILPSGQLKIGLINPEDLLALLESTK